MSDENSPLERRYGIDASYLETLPAYKKLEQILARGSCRKFQDRQVDASVIELLCAAAFASPSKSDLQQRDIILISDVDIKAQLADLMDTQAWVKDIPHLAVFCGNNRRQRQIHALRGHPFENDHLDAFFNASVDAGIALSAFVTAAEAIGLGCCPISAIRNESEAVSDVLKLPDHVFPVAGLAFGYPQSPKPEISPRLPLEVTVHHDTFSESNIEAKIEAYDARRESIQPYAQQRATEKFGTSENYGWSEDKTRQYTVPEREDFGKFVRVKGFDLG